MSSKEKPMGNAKVVPESESVSSAGEQEKAGAPLAGNPEAEGGGATPVLKERAEQIADAITRSSAARRLVEEFGAKIIGVVDQQTGAAFGHVGKPGVPYAEWDQRQRTLPN